MLFLAAAPQKLSSKTLSPFNSHGNGFKIDRGEGRIHGHLKTSGRLPDAVDLKVSGSDNDGAFAVFEQTVLAKGAGIPLHFHADQDEMFYVLDGTYRLMLSDEIFDLKAGASIFLSRKVSHACMLTSVKGTTH